ncbi:TolC family protein [Fulvivirgaceae bacterium BMA12]|uniref:TolC family protein n=1 Tax=Agaribacillus aureus TaxID=3051825 RepID=A0ABT8L5Q1_9BACT|nr:TolC family protein [Fulvivirgaceae bacterium BMA12]
MILLLFDNGQRIVMTVMVLLITIASLNGQTGNGPPLQLKQVIAEVLAHHPVLDQSAGRVKLAKAQIGKIKSRQYPQVLAQGSYVYLNEVSTIELPMGDQLVSRKIFQEDNWDFELMAQYTALDFGRRNTAVKMARQQQQLAAHVVSQIEQQLSLAAIKVFHSILFTQEAIEVQNEQLASLHRDLLRTESLIRNESATSFDLLTTQARISKTENQKIHLESQRKIYLIALNKLMGKKGHTFPSLEGSFDFERQVLDKEGLFQKALAQRKEYAIAKKEERLKELQYNLALKDHMPVLNLGLKGGFRNGYLPDLAETRSNYTGLAMLSVPIFQGFKTSYDKQAAKIQRQIASSKSEEVRNEIYAEVSEHATNLASNYIQLENTQLLVAQATEAASQARKRYENELITNLDLLDAELAVSQARLALLEVKFQCVLNSYQLRWALGETLQ